MILSNFYFKAKRILMNPKYSYIIFSTFYSVDSDLFFNIVLLKEVPKLFDSLCYKILLVLAVFDVDISPSFLKKLLILKFKLFEAF